MRSTRLPVLQSDRVRSHLLGNKRKIKTTARFNGGLIQQAPKPLGRQRIVAASTIPAQIDPLDDGYLSAFLIKGAAPTTGSGYNYLLSVGPIAVGTQASAVVYLTNRTSQQLTLQATASGSYTTMQLEAGNSQNGVGTLKMAPESEVALTVWFKPTDISQQNLQRVVIQSNNERPIDVILVYVLLGAPSLTLTNTAGPFVSGLGGSWNKTPYSLSLGPAPLLYLLSGEPSMTAQGQMDRLCKNTVIHNWLDCRPVIKSNTNVSWTFSIQGLEDTAFKTANTVTATATLSANYTAARSAPTLYIIGEPVRGIVFRIPPLDDPTPPSVKKWQK